ncbi:MAG TPA: hypothetical protein DEP84_26780 [Chloroflexi bacterium]|nr:hypothetical protein [Chloroflexota bacterium]
MTAVLLLSLLAACAGRQPATTEVQATTVVEREVTTVVEKEVEVTRVVEKEVEVTRVVEVEAPPKEPVEKVVVVAETIEPETFDPIMSSGLDWHAQVWSTVLETLAWTDPSGNVHPRLAESWEVSDDGLTYTFTLRPDVKFHNGEPLQADDVVYSFERGQTQGIPMVQQRYQNIVGVEAPDDQTVVVTLAQPDNFFLNTIGDPTGIGFSILNREYGAENRNAIAPVGTGPFRFVSYSPNNELVLEVNREYWNPEDLPDWDRLIIRWFQEDASQVAALNAGEVDVIQPVSIATSQSLTDQPGIGKASFPALSFFISISRIGKTEPPEIPLAISKALDREALAQIAFLGEAEPGSTVHPYVEYALPIEELPNYQRDVEGCKELLAKAGYANGIDVEFLYPTRNPFEDVIFETIQASLAECGINITLAPVEQAVWLDRFLKADYDLSATDQSWYSNPIRYVLPRVGWQAPVEEVVPELPPLLEEFSAASPAERPEVFQKIQRLVAETGYPFIGTVWVNRSVFWRTDRVENVDTSTRVTNNRRDFYLSIHPVG